MNSTYINAIRRIKVENELVHFELGENRPSKNGSVDELIALNVTMSKKEFINMIGYLDNFVNTNILKKSIETSPVTMKTKKITNQNDPSAEKRIKISSTK